MKSNLLLLLVFATQAASAQVLDSLKAGRFGDAVSSVLSKPLGGDAETFYKKGLELEKKGDSDSALSMYRAAAENGHVKAGYKIARYAHQGLGQGHQGLRVDLPRAVEWYSWAAKKGHRRARLYLGEMYLQGEGVNQNSSMARELLLEAGKAGAEDAFFLLGDAYFRGYGVSQSKSEAAKYFRLASDGGDPNATMALARMYESRDGVLMGRHEAKRLLSIVTNQVARNASDARSDD
jgi:TPR repeat protein